MDWTPHITVAAVVESAQRFLLIEEYVPLAGGHDTVVLNQPAGHWDEGETLIQASIRETLEETAWHFTPEAIVGFYHYITSHQSTYLRICFCGRVERHEAHRPLDKGIIRTVWLSREEVAMRQNLRSPMVLRCIDDYLAGIRYPLTLITQMNLS